MKLFWHYAEHRLNLEHTHTVRLQEQQSCFVVWASTPVNFWLGLSSSDSLCQLYIRYIIKPMYRYEFMYRPICICTGMFIFVSLIGYICVSTIIFKRVRDEGSNLGTVHWVKKVSQEKNSTVVFWFVSGIREGLVGGRETTGQGRSRLSSVSPPPPILLSTRPYTVSQDWRILLIFLDIACNPCPVCARL